MSAPIPCVSFPSPSALDSSYSSLEDGRLCSDCASLSDCCCGSVTDLGSGGGDMLLVVEPLVADASEPLAFLAALRSVGGPILQESD